MILQLYKITRYFFFLLFFLFSIYAANFYEGSILIFNIYCISFIFLLFYLTDKKSNYFEIFFSIYLFLGFWFKYIFSLIYLNGAVSESGQTRSDDIDQILLIGILIACICVVASFLNKKLFKKKTFNIENKKKSYFENFYLNNRYFTLLAFVLFFCFIGYLNTQLGIYQRGFISLNKIHPMFVNLIKWLLIFGFTTFSCFIIHIEILYRKKIGFLTILIAISEICISYTTTLSRMYLIKVPPILLPICQELINLKKNVNKYFYLTVIFFLFSSFLSLYYVSSIRLAKFDHITKEHNSIIKEHNSKQLLIDQKQNKVKNTNIKKSKKETENKNIKRLIKENSPSEKPLSVILHIAVNRWIGIDSLIKVFNYKDKGFNLLIEALNENKSNLENTFFEKKFTSGRLIAVSDSIISKGNTLPGIISFLYYYGNIYFVLFSLFLLITLFNCFENYLKKITKNNLIFASFISSIIASRLFNFGYAPKDSYLFLISILLSIFVMIFLQKVLSKELYKK